MELLERKIDIMGLCETKLSKENQHFAFADQKQYKCFSSAEPNNPRSAGVALLIRKNIERFIASVDKIEGHLIAINLLNKGYKTWIAQIYLPSDRRQSRALQKKIQDLLQAYSRKNYEIIIMGDFNATANPRTDRKSLNSTTEFTRSEDPEIELFEYMNNWNLSDLQQLWEPTETPHTWRNKLSSSRIDYIWGSYSIANNMFQFSNEDFRSTSNSDHDMLILQIARSTILKDHQINTSVPKPPREKIININKTTDSQWKKYTQKVDQKLQQSNILHQIRMINSNQTDDSKRNQLIQDSWNLFERILISSAFNQLHCEKRTARGRIKFQDKKKNHREQLAFYSYHSVNRILNNWSKLKDPKEGPILRQKLWKELKKINQNIAPIAPVLESTHKLITILEEEEKEHTLTSQLKETANSLKRICLNEERNRVNLEIKKAIQERCRNLKENQRKVVQGLTNNFRDKIIIDRIRIQDD
jgi:hypothetical protein